MMVAAHNGHSAFMQRLLAAGAKLEAHDTTAEVRYYHGKNARPVADRWTLLHSAAMGGANDVITYLLDKHGYAVDARDHGGWTPLHVAVFYPLASGATLDLLLARGADPNAEDALGQNSAAHARDAEFLLRLLDAGAHPDGGNFVPPADDPHAEAPQRPIARMVNKRDRDGIELLVARGANVTADALELAAMFSPELVPLLVAHEPSDDLLAAAIAAASDDATFELLVGKLREVSPRVLLDVIARAAKPMPRVRALLARGVAIDDTRDAVGKTALHLAAERGDLELVQLLVEAGADPNAFDQKRKTPRALAFERDADDVRRFLDLLTRLPATPPPPAAAPKTLVVGTRVTHAKFGAGAVVRVNGDKATVKFDGGAGEKTLLARVLAFE
jgi:ankyrin repeat protein